MVQLSVVDPSGLGARERNRLHRLRTYVAAALDIVFDDGLDALTMQRLAQDVGASVGSVYTYFPSKTALVAEVQREAIERLATSAGLMVSDLDRITDGEGSPAATLAPVLAFGRFWLTASDTFPQEMRLLMLLLSDFSMPDEDALRVLPSALRLLGLTDDRFHRAVEAGVITVEREPERLTVDLAAALTGCLLLAVVERFDDDILSPVGAGRAVLDTLTIGWGARPDVVAEAHRLVDRLEEAGPLARPLPKRGA